MIDTSVIIHLKGCSKHVEKVLLAYNQQNYMHFEVILVAEANIDLDTVLGDLKDNLFYPIQVLRYTKNETSLSVNSILEAINSEYLVFVDSCMLPSRFFVENHIRYRRVDTYIYNRGLRLPKTTLEDVTNTDIMAQHCFDNLQWLKDKVHKPFLLFVVGQLPFGSWFLNTLLDKEFVAVSFYKDFLNKDNLSNVFQKEETLVLSIAKQLTSKTKQTLQIPSYNSCLQFTDA